MWAASLFFVIAATRSRLFRAVLQLPFVEGAAHIVVDFTFALLTEFNIARLIWVSRIILNLHFEPCI